LSMIEFEGRPAVLGIAFDITERKRTEVALEESEKRSRQLTSYLLTAQEKERKRISLELHDELGQSLTVLKLKLRAIERGLNEDQSDSKAECFNILQDIDQLIENIRRLTRDLSPTILEDLGLTAAIRWMVHDFAKLNGNRVTLNIQDINHLFARAAHVSVSAEKKDAVVLFIIQDDGKGFNTHLPFAKIPNVASLGLAAMNERARMLGASFKIHSKLGAGTKIILEIPIDDKRTSQENTHHDALSHHTC
jgi:signal transduction histidine kinase